MQALLRLRPSFAYKWQVMLTVAIGVWMIVLDSTVVNVAFPTLRSVFGADLDQTQWVISIYVLALGIATPLAGFLADRFGIKRVYLGGLGLFVVGSMLSGLAPSLSSLIAARAFQGLGGGIAQPLSVALLFLTFPPLEQGRALGIFGIVMVGAPALGPILGGFLVDEGLWRWIFFINAPLGLIGILLATMLLHPTTQPRPVSINPVGVITAAAGCGCILYGASIASRGGWSSVDVLGTLSAGAASLIAFAIIELRFSREPILDLRLFRDRVFLNASLVGYVAVIALFGAEFLMPVYLQVLRGRTAMESGLLLLPIAIAAGISNPVSGYLYDKIGPRVLVTTGLILLLVNTWQFSDLTATTPMDSLLWLLALRGLAISLVMQSTMTTALGAVPRHAVPRGSSLVMSTRYIAQALGVALLAAVLASAQSPESQQMDRPRESSYVASAAGACVEQLGGANVGTALLNRACEEKLLGMRRAYRVTFYAALVALLMGTGLPGWPSVWTGRRGMRDKDETHPDASRREMQKQPVQRGGMPS